MHGAVHSSMLPSGAAMQRVPCGGARRRQLGALFRCAEIEGTYWVHGPLASRRREDVYWAAGGERGARGAGDAGGEE